MKTISLFFVALALAVGLAPRASGALLAYEGFDYTTGTSFINSNGGFGFSQAWQTNSVFPSASATNAASSLSYTDSLGHILLTAGGSVFLTGAAGSAAPFRTLNNGFGPDTGTLWYSFVGQRTGPVTNTVPPFYQRVASLQISTNTSERLAVGRASYNTETSPAVWDTWALYTAGSGGNSQLSTNSLTNVTFLVVRVDFAVGNDTAYLFVNPPDLATEPALGTASCTNSTADLGFNRFRLFTGNNSTASGIYAEMRFDEIRLGTTYADVTPYTTPGGGGFIPPTKWLASVALANSLSLTLTGGLGSNYVIQASTNVADINSWSAIGNLTLDGSGLGTFVDTNIIATNVQRYYRSKIP